MENENLYLFSSLLGVEDEAAVNSYMSEIRNGTLYFNLFKNCEIARKYNTYTSNRLVDDFNRLFYECHTFKDAYILNIKVEALYQVSSIKYYLNPLLNNDEFLDNSVDSIGDLMVYFNDEYVSINWLIQDFHYDINLKMDAINKQILRYHQELNSKLSENIDNLKKESSILTRKAKKTWVDYLTFLIVFAFNLAVLALLFINDPRILSGIYYPDGSSVYTYIFYLPTVSVIVLDFIYLFYYVLKSRLFRIYFFSKRLLRLNESKVFNAIAKDTINLKRYIEKHMRRHQILKGDIKMFSNNDDYIIFKDITTLRKGDENGFYIFLYTFKNIMLVLAFISIIFMVVSLIVMFM